MGYVLYWTIVIVVATGLLTVVVRLLRAVFHHLLGPASSAPGDTWYDEAMNPDHPDHWVLMSMLYPNWPRNYSFFRDDDERSPLEDLPTVTYNAPDHHPDDQWSIRAD